MAEKKFSILYVDDEPDNLTVFKATFRREYKIHLANSAREGIELLKNNEVHLIITDQRMPEMTGVQFLESILPEYPDAIRIILTGFSDVEAIIQAINSGQVFRYITKPWNEQELRMTLENARELYFLRRRNKNLFRELQTKLEEQEKTLQVFRKYVPEPVVEKALSSSADSIFDGEQRKVSVLFCDIRGFTAMSEDLPPKEVVDLLNGYYAKMTDVIEQAGGSVIQFVGDEIFAVFGAPVAVAHHEEKAVWAALEMMDKLKDLNQLNQQKFGREIKVGIGINSGEVVAGNLGSHNRIGYSITGDTVNTGKRIETATRQRPNTILISQSVRNNLQARFDIKALAPISVHGKKEPIQVFEVNKPAQ